jgi:hypothetical protein
MNYAYVLLLNSYNLLTNTSRLMQFTEMITLFLES